MTYDEYLAHHGIIGMRWGKRNGPPYPLKRSQMSSAEKRNASQKSVEEMSDEELNRALNRLRKESEYKKLINPKNDSEVKKYVNKLIAATGGVAVGLLSKKLGGNFAAGALAAEALISTFSKELITNLFFKGKVV